LKDRKKQDNASFPLFMHSYPTDYAANYLGLDSSYQFHSNLSISEYARIKLPSYAAFMIQRHFNVSSQPLFVYIRANIYRIWSELVDHMRWFGFHTVVGIHPMCAAFLWVQGMDFLWELLR
jgi:hypothetical protein